MKTIILGYTDRSGLVGEKCICLPSVPVADQTAIWNKAKQEHVFPKGTQSLRLIPVDFDRSELAGFVSDEVASRLASVADALKKAEAANKAKEEAKAKDSALIAAAQSKVQEAVKARNKLLTQQSAAEAKLRNSRIASERTPSGNSASEIKNAEAEVNRLIPLTSEAIANCEAAIKELADLKSQQTNQQTKSQLTTK